MVADSPTEHPYNTFFRPCTPGFPEFAPVGTIISEVESLIAGDIDADESPPPVVGPFATEPENCDAMQILSTLLTVSLRCPLVVPARPSLTFSRLCVGFEPNLFN